MPTNNEDFAAQLHVIADEIELAITPSDLEQQVLPWIVRLHQLADEIADA